MDLSIYSKVKVPRKFKMPKFEKCDGTSCLKIHLQTYLVQKTQYVDSVLLMIQSFRANLTRPTLQWYIMKKINLLGTYEEFTGAFLK